MKKIFLPILILALLLIPPAAIATITIGIPSFNKAVVYEQEEVVFSVPIASDNDVSDATVEIKNITLDLLNISYQNYTLLRVGAATSGNWIYFFKVGPGIYQVKQVMATDNSSASTFRSFEQSTIAFKALPSTTTTTLTATTTTTATTATATPTNTTTTSTTTQTSATNATSATQTTTTAAAASTPTNIFQQQFQQFTEQLSKLSLSDPLSFVLLMANPIFLILLAIVMIIPVIIYLLVTRKKPEQPIPSEEPAPSGI